MTKRRVMRGLLCGLLLMAAWSAPARGLLGLAIRGGVNVTDFSASYEGLSISTRMGFHAAVATPIQLGVLGVQPELMYVHNSMNMNGMRVKVNTLELPVLGTLRLLGPLSVFVGPSFALANDSHYKNGAGERINFGNAKPTVTYILGANLLFNKHVLIDVRYSGSFNRTHNYFEGVEPRVRSYALLLSVGYQF